MHLRLGQLLHLERRCLSLSLDLYILVERFLSTPIRGTKDSPFHQCDLQRTVLFYDLRADVVAARGSGNNSERNFMFTSHPILDPVSNTLILHKLKILVMLSFATHNR